MPSPCEEREESHSLFPGLVPSVLPTSHQCGTYSSAKEKRRERNELLEGSSVGYKEHLLSGLPLADEDLTLIFVLRLKVGSNQLKIGLLAIAEHSRGSQ